MERENELNELKELILKMTGKYLTVNQSEKFMRLKKELLNEDVELSEIKFNIFNLSTIQDLMYNTNLTAHEENLMLKYVLND